MEIIENRISFLDGFLQGISEIDGRIREFKILAGMIDYDQKNTFLDHFSKMLKPELTVKTSKELKIDLKIFEYELMKNILKNPFNLDIIDHDRKKYIVFRIIDYIEDSIEDFVYGSMSIFDLTIEFNEGRVRINRYFIIPVGNKAIFILFRAPNEIL